MTAESTMTLTLLRGHVSPETAHVTEDYPYGRTLRCKRRMWVESPTKGAGKGRQRIATQTTNPKAQGEVWNKPHYGQYSDRVYMVLDNRNGYVHSFPVSFYGSEALARLHGAGVYAQMNEEERKRVTNECKVSEVLNARYCKPGEFNCFQRHNILMARIREHVGSYDHIDDKKQLEDELKKIVGIMDIGENKVYDSEFHWAYVQVMAEDFGIYLEIPVYKSED